MKLFLIPLTVLFVMLLFNLDLSTHTNEKVEYSGYLMVKTGPRLEYFLNNDGKIITLKGDIKTNLANNKVLVSGILKENILFLNNIVALEQRNLPSFITPLTHSPKGPQSTYVILVEFTDVKFNTSLSSIKHILDEMNRFYLEASYNTTYFNYTIHPSMIELNRNLSYYGADCYAGVDCRFLDFVSDALTTSQVDLAKYYRIIIIHAGKDQALTGNSDDIWSASSLGEWSIAKQNNYYKVSVSVLSEKDPMGVFAHEVAHQLGLPDLYLYPNFTSMMGRWDLMDGGAFNGNPVGSSPSHMNALLKYYLGWIDNSSVMFLNQPSLLRLNLAAQELSNSSLKLITLEIDADHLLALEIRRKIGFDAFLPGEGLLIIYVDKTKKSGEGPMKLITFKDLKSAAFGIGNSYVNDTIKTLITVLSSLDFSFDIGLSYKIWVKVNSIKASKERTSINEKVSLNINISWYNNTPAKNLEIVLNSGERVMSTDNGNAVIELIRNEVGMYNFTVKNVLYEKIPVYTVSNYKASIVWDAVEIYQTSYEKRVNVGSTTTIYFKARYAYDKEKFDNSSGYLYVNGTLANYSNGYWYFSYGYDKVAKLTFVISEVRDLKYGIKSIIYSEKKPEIIWDRLRVVNTLNETRVNVGQEAKLYFEIVSEYDNSPVVDANVKVAIEIYQGNNTIRLIKEGIYDQNKKKWLITFSYNNVSKVIFKLNDILWYDYNLTSFDEKYSYICKIIFDKLQIIKYYPNNIRVEINNTIKLYTIIVYSSDGKPLEDSAKVYINDKLAMPAGNGSFYIIESSNTLKELRFKVTNISSSKYNVTLFESNNYGYIIFDKIAYDFKINYNLFTYNVKIKVYYLYDNKIVENANLFVNNERAILKDSWYTVSMYDFGVIQNINVKISANGFKDIEINIYYFNAINLIFYILILIFILILVRNLKKLRS